MSHCLNSMRQQRGWMGEGGVAPNVLWEIVNNSKWKRAKKQLGVREQSGVEAVDKEFQGNDLWAKVKICRFNWVLTEGLGRRAGAEQDLLSEPPVAVQCQQAFNHI